MKNKNEATVVRFSDIRHVLAIVSILVFWNHVFLDHNSIQLDSLDHGLSENFNRHS
jgi:hypothetical protein